MKSKPFFQRDKSGLLIQKGSKDGSCRSWWMVGGNKDSKRGPNIGQGGINRNEIKLLVLAEDNSAIV